MASWLWAALQTADSGGAAHLPLTAPAKGALKVISRVLSGPSFCHPPRSYTVALACPTSPGAIALACRPQERFDFEFFMTFLLPPVTFLDIQP